MSLTESTPEAAARAASLSARSLAVLPVSARNDALAAMHEALLRNKESILAANAQDMVRATSASQSGNLSQSVLKRLDLSRPGKYEDMLQGILDVRGLDDPIGKCDLRTLLDDGLELERVSCPIGVLLIIFEARPEVIANIAALAIKSGNAAILKGGKESTNSFETIAKVIGTALEETQVPNAAIQLVKTRDVIDQLLGLDRYIDLVIPRGGNELVRNALRKVLTPTNAALVQEASEEDYNTEFLDLIMAVKTVPATTAITNAQTADEERSNDASLDLAIAHINTHGSKHTDCIVTSSEKAAEKFMSSVDAAGVYWNASTRFADGMRYGFGTEVGISTNKIHSRGPVGLEGLTIYKYKLRGHGQTAGEFGEGSGKRKYKHERLDI
ncbi:glutamate-5-semialdehyde dehydrogenase [Exophiala xenobiotica]|nr:glutamate-5-semialdehyde dehydrogenase [Exophiala xenobiotica]